MTTDAKLIEADVRARETALDVSRSFIVQAPAGSGKTELLIQRYLRLLTIVGQPEEILAITFTNKAAKEMQLRVVNALRQAREKVVAETAHERLTIAAATEVLARDEACAWRLIESPGRMRIQTVDAFGAGIARALPMSSGLGGSGATLADASMKRIYRDAAAATLDYMVTSGRPGKSVECVLVHLDNNISLYIDYVARMLASREQWLSITGGGLSDSIDADATRKQLESNITDIVDGQLHALHAQLPAGFVELIPEFLRYAAKNLLDEGKNTHPLAGFLDAHELPPADSSGREQWQAIANLLLIKDGSWRRSINKNDGFPAGDSGQKKSLIGLIETLRNSHTLRDSLVRIRLLPAAEYSDEQWDVLLALFDILPRAAGELRRMFGERGVTDHNEVALSAGRALGDAENPGDIAMILDYKVQHLLIDEMQDTSIGQYEMLKTLTAGWVPGDGRSIFCVGDPMQSIYRFRDAEVGEFLLARKNGIGDVKLESLLLRRNFRSGENLVHWFNTVFLQVMPRHDDLSVGAISYSESAPVELHSGCGDYAVHALFDADAAAEARCTVNVIQDCLATDGDVAVLVRSRTQLSELLPAMRQAGVEYQAIEIDRLTDLPEIIDALALTRAFVHRADRLAWLALLRGPWVGLCWQDLHALVRNDSKRTVIELCMSDERVARLTPDGASRLQRFVEIIRPFMQRSATQTLRDRVELAWFALGGPALLADTAQLENVYKYFAALEKLEQAGSLEDVRELEQRLDDERVSSSDSSTCRVQIMTMHKAKGLQFDHVVLPALGRRTRGTDKEVLSWLTVPGESGSSEMIISPVGPRSEVDNDPLHRFIAATDNDKSKMELDRLLYVACTRAIKSLHLIGNIAVAANGEQFNDPFNGSLLSRLWPAIEAIYSRAFTKWQENGSTGSLPGKSNQLVNPRLRRFGDAWSAPSPSPVNVANAEHSIAEQTDEQEVEYYWVGSAARQAGTIVHRWFQRISDGLVNVEGGDLGILQSTTRRWALDLGVGEAQIEDVCYRVDSALSGILSDEKGQWVMYGEGRSELAITGLVDGQTESVVVDRVRIDDKGVHWIVDYKTSTHEGGDLKGFLRHESERYRPQLRKYASLYASLTGEQVRTALYFPLLQEFCEVEI